MGKFRRDSARRKSRRRPEKLPQNLPAVTETAGQPNSLAGKHLIPPLTHRSVENSRGVPRTHKDGRQRGRSAAPGDAKSTGPQVTLRCRPLRASSNDHSGHPELHQPPREAPREKYISAGFITRVRISSSKLKFKLQQQQYTLFTNYSSIERLPQRKIEVEAP